MKIRNIKWFFLICCLYGFRPLVAQMTFSGQKMYGFEWIKQNQKYYKFQLAEDGIYRLDYEELEKAGIPVQSIRGDQYQIFNLGREISIFVSSKAVFGPDDYIEFMGFRNRSELDRALFSEGQRPINSEFSMFTDSAAYFLSWSAQPSGYRYEWIQNDLSNPLPKDLYYINKVVQNFPEFATKRSFGYQNSQKMPDFDEGQGYGTSYFQSRDFDLNFDHIHSQGPNARITGTVLGYGEDFSAHKATFFVDNVEKGFITFAGYKVRDGVVELFADELKPKMKLKVLANGNPDDRLSLSVLQYEYPAEFNFDNKSYSSIYIPPSVIRKNLEIENFDGGEVLTLYDLTNQLRISSTREPSGVYRFTIPASTEERRLILIGQKAILNEGQIKEVRFQKPEAADYNYIILSSKKLIDAGTVKEYENYRKSAAGGSYKVVTVAAEELYDLFGFGIKGHSIALRNFLQYTRQVWPAVKHVLIIGKGLEYKSYRKTGNDELNFVPTYSMPAADYMLVSDSARMPFYALGRIPAIDNEELKAYFDKVKEHESYLSGNKQNISDKEWIKKVVHLSGGDPSLFTTISTQLASMEQVIENNSFGAEVETFYKQSSNPIEVSNSDKLKSRIDQGVSIISFMGHSVAFRLDFNLENISSYQNKGRYHLFMAMGCYAGQMFEPLRSISEAHNLAKDRGSVVYLANSTAGLPYILSVYGSEFYKQLGQDLYGQTIGEAVQAVNMVMIQNFNTTKNEAIAHQALSTSYNGDPAVRLLIADYPDFLPDAATAATQPVLLYADKGPFDFGIDLVNLGKTIQDSIRVEIRNEDQSGQFNTIFDGKVVAPVQRSRYHFSIPVLAGTQPGFYKIHLKVDSDNLVDERPRPQAEENNSLFSSDGEPGYPYYLLGNEIRPVHPREFSIIGTDSVVLVANTGNMFSPQKRYFFELDTTGYFNSPMKLAATLVRSGGVISWKPEIVLSPERVYYWRVRPDSVGSGILAWRESSFIYLPGKKDGWNQSHFFQDRKNRFDQMQLQEPDRRLSFKEALEDFRVFLAATTPSTFLRPKIFYRGSVEMDYNHFNFNNNISGILVSVFDPLNGDLWVNRTGGDFGSFNQSGFAGNKFFLFPTETPVQREALMNFLDQDVPDRAVVTIMTLVQQNKSFFPEEWEKDGSRNLYSTFKKFGSSQVDQLKQTGSIPYIFIFRKGRPDFAPREKFGDLINEIDLAHYVPIRFTQGNLNSLDLGPVRSWERCLWDFSEYDPATESLALNVTGIKSDESEETLFRDVVLKDIDLTQVDAQLFPRLKLQWTTMDIPARTSPQKNYWRVLYEGLPDVAIDQSLGFLKSQDTLNQGEVFRLEIMAHNLSTYDMDSLLVRFTIEGPNNSREQVYARLSSIAAGRSIRVPFAKSTSRQVGSYRVFVELNPDQDQPELYYFNNVGIVDYYVNRDRRRPRLFLTFDGREIEDGDQVSACPTIELTLRDENQAYLLDDTSLFQISLRFPDRSINPVYFAQSYVHFIPALESDRNEAKVLIDAVFEQEGIYSLVVRARDPNGNPISESDFVISFKVKKKSSTPKLYNYPNPFDQKTRFIYTLTESVSPYYKMEIWSLSGKLLREVNQDELGPLNPGTHKLEYEYDGTDEMGHKLPSGIYLYRMIPTDDQGKIMKPVGNGAEAFFKDNVGKMVIMR